MTSHRTLSVGILLTTVAIALTACSTPAADPPAEADSITIAYAGVDESVPLYRVLGDGLQALADENGDELLRYDNSLDAVQALSNAKLMVQKQPDIVVEWSGAGNNDALANQFEDAEIPCIAVNIPITGCALFNLDQAGFGRALGASVAETALAEGWTADDTVVVLMSVTSAGPDPIINAGGFYETYAEAFPDMEQKSAEDFELTTTSVGDSGRVVDGGGSVDTAFAAMQSTLQTIDPDQNIAFYAINDAMAAGALRAVEQSGRSGGLLIASTGAEASALDGLRTNDAWVAEGDLGLTEWARYVTAMSRAVLAGTEMPELTISPFNVLTKDNLDTYYEGDEPKSEFPVPAGDEYLVEFGL